MNNKKYSDKMAVIANQNIKERDYWLDQLAGDPVKSCFPYDFKLSEQEKAEDPGPYTKQFSFRFPGELFSKAMKLSDRSHLKLHMLLAAGLMILLEKYSGGSDIIIASPILRQETGTRFINTLLVFRNRVEKHLAFKEFLMQVRETIVKATENQNYPMAVLFDRLNRPAGEYESPFSDVVLLLENLHDKGYLENTARNITFSFFVTDGHVQGVIDYHSRLYGESTIERIAGHFMRIMDTVLSDVNIPLAAIGVLSEAEKKQILVEFNRSTSQANPPANQTLHQLFEKRAAESPDNIALAYNNHQVSYGELDERSDRLAGLLREKGVTRGAIAALRVGPSIEMMTGQLGILKAGAAYLPLALDAPPGRVRFMLEDSGAPLLVTTGDLSKQGIQPGKWKGGNIFIEECCNKIPVAPAAKQSNGPANSPAYIIYTSGTTGQPKGVIVEHCQVVSYLHAFYNQFNIEPKDTVIQLSSYAFDVFIEEVYPLLLKGGKILIPEEKELLDIQHLSRLVMNHRVTIIDCTPLMLNEFNKQCKNTDTFASVHTFISGGDILKEEYIDHLAKQGTVYNTYGPTETTVCAAYYKYTKPLRTTIPIGKPITGYHIYILSKDFSLQPIGTTGEICIAGPGLTRGYLNRPELTAEKFCLRRPGGLILKKPPPWTPRKNFCLTRQKFCGGPGGGFSKEPPGRRRHELYKTGDLGRWLPDGNIEFTGRTDHQVKIRGYRIETGEIESLLLKRGEIADVVVAARQDTEKEKYLCAYIVLAGAGEKEKAVHEMAVELREYLLQRLPDYMIPSFFVPVERIPLTANGKIDRKALPQPEILGRAAYAAPGNPVEEGVTTIWEEVFGISPIGVNDDFFDLGGHSLRGIQVINEIHKTFDVKVPLEEIFLRFTIRALSQYIKEAAKEKHTLIEAVEKQEYYPLSSAQKRLYILQQMDPDSTAYNMPQQVPLEEEPDREKLEKVFIQLIKRHESLRTSFESIDGQAVQMIHNENYKFRITNIMEDFVQPFDLSKASLLRVALVETGESKHLLLVDMHHIISDAVSYEVLIKDFFALGAGEELPPLRLYYKDFSGWQNREKERGNIKKQQDYWLAQFAGEIPVLNIPTDYDRPAMQRFEGNTIEFSIAKKVTGALKAMALEQGTTMFMVFLALYNVMLAKMCRQQDIVVGIPAAGRGHSDLDQVIGMFVNTLALRNYPQKEKSFREFLAGVKKRTLEAFENQDYQFEDLVEQVAAHRDVNRNPLFDVMFSFVEFDKEQSKEAVEAAGEQVPAAAKFDITFIVLKSGEEDFRFAVRYSTILFKEETIEKFIETFKKLVSLVIENPARKISEIELVSAVEKEKVAADSLIDLEAE